MVGEVLNEALVEVCEPDEGLDFAFISGSRPLCDSGHLYWVHSDFSFRDNESKVLDFHSFKLTLLWLEVELVPLKPFYHLPDYPPVLCQGFGEDQDVIQIHTNHPFHDEVTEDVVHHCLEGHWTVCEPEEHDQWFKEPLVGSCFHSSPSEMCKLLYPHQTSSLEMVYGLGDERDWYWFFTVMAFRA